MDEVSWVADTGEVYVMAEPNSLAWVRERVAGESGSG